MLVRHARGRGQEGISHFLKPRLGLLEEKLFRLQQLLFPFKPELSGLKDMLFRLQHLLCPFEPGLSGFEEKLFRLQPLPFPFKPGLFGLEEKLFPLQHLLFPFEPELSGLKETLFRLQPHSLFLEPLQPRVHPEEHGFRRRPHPNEDRRCRAPGIVPRRSPAAMRMVSHSKLGYRVLQPADEWAWGGNRPQRRGDAEL